MEECIMKLHSYQDSNQALCLELLEKSRNFYTQHFLFLDAVFGGSQTTITTRKPVVPKRRLAKCDYEASRKLVARIRLISTKAFRCQHKDQPHRFWADVLSITP